MHFFFGYFSVTVTEWSLRHVVFEPKSRIHYRSCINSQKRNSYPYCLLKQVTSKPIKALRRKLPSTKKVPNSSTFIQAITTYQAISQTRLYHDGTCKTSSKNTCSHKNGHFDIAKTETLTFFI